MKIAFLIYDNDSSVNEFPLGVGYLIATLRNNGFDDSSIHVLNMDVYHHGDKELFEHLDRGRFDAVCIGMIAGYWQYKQFKRMMNAIHSLKNRPPVILGGYMFTPDPSFFMRRFDADYVVLGEGERSFPLLIDALAEGQSVENIPGLAWRDGDEIRINPRQKPIKDLDSIPFPAWDKFPIENYVTKVRIKGIRAQRSMPVLTSRGCAYHCAFCYRMEPGYRMRSMDSVMEECKNLIRDFRLNAICFRDELVMVTPDRARCLAERILSEGLNIRFDIDGRLNAVDEEVLALLKKAGCVYINYGVESLDQTVLDNMNKNQTVEQIHRGIELTVKAGIHPGLNVIFGNVGDDNSTARKTVDFLLKYNTYGELRTLKPVTPYPGSALFDLAVKRGSIRDVEDFYENKHLNSDRFACNFTKLSDDEIYGVMLDANKILIEDHFKHLAQQNIEAHRRLYFEGDVSFRGVRS